MKYDNDDDYLEEDEIDEPIKGFKGLNENSDLSIDTNNQEHLTKKRTRKNKVEPKTIE